jgi:hypothetical protein
MSNAFPLHQVALDGSTCRCKIGFVRTVSALGDDPTSLVTCTKCAQGLTSWSDLSACISCGAGATFNAELGDCKCPPLFALVEFDEKVHAHIHSHIHTYICTCI